MAYGANFKHAICNGTVMAADAGTGFVKVEQCGFSQVIILTQTCDICEEDKKRPGLPFITVAPVYDILPFLRAGQDNQVRANRVGALAPLTGTAFCQVGRLFVADLRFEFPLEKSVLVDQSAIEAFQMEAEYSRFSEKLAFKRSRPAIDTRVRKLISIPLHQLLTANDKLAENIVEVRLQCSPWDRADRARLYVLTRSADDVDAVGEQLESWDAEITAALPSDLVLLPTNVIPYADFSYAASRETVELDYSELSDDLSPARPSAPAA